MNAFLSIELNNPDRSRSEAMTFEISTPYFDDFPDDPTISVTAIGMGSTFPLVISIRNSARALPAKT